jgi:iron-sulfur cluster assembly accessory protein
MLAEQVQTEFITLTPAAAEAVRNLMAKRNLTGYALRVFVSGGGCSGFQYGMALEDKFRDLDLSGEFDGVKVVVDEVSIQYLQGATVDYVEGVMGSGFKIENPNAVSSCGCGDSCRSKDSANADGNNCSDGCS